MQPHGWGRVDEREVNGIYDGKTNLPSVSFCSLPINVARSDKFQKRRGKLGLRDKTSSGSPTGPSSNKSSSELPGKSFNWEKSDPCYE